jgi:hypothetical protein
MLMGLDNIPQPLYKYRIWDSDSCPLNFGERMLTENEVYLASPDQFNDPFDCSLPFKYNENDLTPENIYQKISQLTNHEFPNKTPTEVREICDERFLNHNLNDKDYWKSFYKQFKEEVNNTFGILSLTSKKDNILMWSHYADSHKGFCVGFDKNLLFESCISEAQIGRVIYNEENKFPEIGLFEDATQSVIKITMTKSNHWEYEDEYRIVKHAPRKIIKFPNEAIIEIILGCKMSQIHKEKICEIAKLKFSKAQIFEAKMNLNTFILDIIPLN